MQCSISGCVNPLKNGQRSDNRLENLEVWSIKQPPGQRVSDKIQWCIEYLTQHGYTIEKGN